MAKYTHPGFIICGDFNTFNTDFMNSLLHFKHKIKDPTRGSNILDKIFTSCDEYYKDAEICPPLGRSDHNCMLIVPSMRCIRNVGDTILYKRELSSRALDDIAKELVDFNWSSFYLETTYSFKQTFSMN